MNYAILYIILTILVCKRKHLQLAYCFVIDTTHYIKQAIYTVHNYVSLYNINDYAQVNTKQSTICREDQLTIDATQNYKAVVYNYIKRLKQ